MNLYDSIKEKGKYLGKIEFLKVQLKNKLSRPLPPDIDTKLESIAPETLEKLLDEIFEIESFDDVRDIIDE